MNKKLPKEVFVYAETNMDNEVFYYASSNIADHFHNAGDRKRIGKYTLIEEFDVELKPEIVSVVPYMKNKRSKIK